ncbi:hypothetical protein Nmar_1333 [Nitrosopumilus maritimus SCM1]|uniref:Uncharacterized protein n=1 Tax=Nitrosopumilus maritimus (strain SCM1) TaxID=436308 RepID=A9A2J0_NITMS|nr:hypothetical protein Nmar_1333 [Nitrosopumilus maritimus SCM1]
MPKKRKVRVNPLGIDKKRLVKNHGSPKITNISKQRKNKQNQNKKHSNIREKIKDEKQILLKDSEKLKQNLKKLQTLVISMSGLEKLSKDSIRRIQQKRQKICKENERLFKKINSSAKRLSELETKFGR